MLRTRIFSIEGKLLTDRAEAISSAPNTSVEGSGLPDTGHVVELVKLELRDAHGGLLSENFYWQASQPAELRQLAAMAPVSVVASATQRRTEGWARVMVKLSNQSPLLALMNVVTVRHASSGAPALPAYANDNYVPLLPGEIRVIEIECPSGETVDDLEIALTGWNTQPVTIPVTQ